MALRQIESYPAGGVSSRDNPVNMPNDRYLLMRNFWPQQDGSLRLRDGYTLYANGIDQGTPIHSIIGVVGPGPDYKRLVVFWQGTTPYVLDPETKDIVAPVVRGAAIQSSDRFCYFYTNGHLHAFNGTDAKWYDGFVWRDVGLPKLTPAQVEKVVVAQGLSEISPSDAAAVSKAFVAGISDWRSTYGFKLYLAYFDPTTNEVGPATVQVSSTVTGGALNQSLNLSTLPTSPTFVKLIGITGDGQAIANFAFSVFKSVSSISQSGTTVTVVCLGHGFATGDVVLLQIPQFFDTTDAYRKPRSITVVDPATFTFETTGIGTFTGATTAIKLVSVLPAGTTASLSSPLSVNAPSFGVMYDPSALNDTNSGLPASTIGGAQPGYQFFLSIYNPTTGHVGNRTPIGARLNNAGRANVAFANLPSVATLDSEWVLLMGRTGDGAEVPHAIINSDGSFVTTTADSITLRQSGTDGNTELPARNFPPPGTLDYNAQIAPDPPVAVTFRRAWVESDHCCGTLDGQPTVYRSGSAQDSREGKFVGLPEQSWSPVDIETYPTAAPISAGHGYSGESLVFSKEDSATLIELAGETGWQGPYNIGGAGQFAFAKGWKNLPYSLTGEKQLATGSPDGPIPISDEYEQALLSKIGDKYLGDVELIPVRLPHKRVDVLRISARDKNGAPFTIIHDFNMRDARSPYGQGYEEQMLGSLTNIGVPPIAQWIEAGLQRLNGSVTFSFLYQSGQSVPDVVVGAPLVVANAVPSTFDGAFVAKSINKSTAFGHTTLAITWDQAGIDEAGIGDLTALVPAGFPTFAVVRDENDQPLVLGGASDGNLYKLYDGISDNGTFFTGEALSLKYVGPQRTAIPFLEWYGDPNAKFFIAKELTSVFDASQMAPLCPDDDKIPSEVQGDEGSNHYLVPITDPEMVHVYVLLRLKGYDGGTMDLSDPPHMPVESYGRILMVSPSAGAGRP